MSVDYTTAPAPAYVAPAPAPPQDKPDDGNDAAAGDSKAPDKNFTDIVYALLSKGGKTGSADSAAQASPLGLFLKQATAPAQAAAGTAIAQTSPLNTVINGQGGAAAPATGASLSLDPATAKRLADFLNHLLAGLPADQKNAVMSALQSGNAKDLSSALIATGLTPEKLAAVIEDLKKKDGDGGDADLMAGTVQIVAPPVQRNPIFTPGALGIQQPAKAAPAQKDGAGGVDDGINDVDSQVNPLLTDSNGDTVGAAPVHGPAFDNVLKIFEHAQSSGAVPGTAPAPGVASSPATGAPAQNPAFSAGLSTIPGAPGVTGALDFSGASSGQIYPDGFDWSQKNDGIGAASQAAGLTISGTAVMTSLVSNAAQAITPHPATQIIATTIIKGSADGQSKDITVKLDPPELGKVEIKMTIDKDAGLKAHILVQKPETYLMLQRDSHVLQRALSDAGLDVGGNALNFQMAQDNGSSGQNSGGGGNGGGSGYAGGGDSGAGNVLETTMNWRINPDTGQTHYNIWA
jgi:hypothetical protein